MTTWNHEKESAPAIGATVRVIFNGSAYEGAVIAHSATGMRQLVRFTTGSGRTRETFFSNSVLRGMQTRPAARGQNAAPELAKLLAYPEATR